MCHISHQSVLSQRSKSQSVILFELRNKFFLRIKTVYLIMIYLYTFYINNLHHHQIYFQQMENIKKQDIFSKDGESQYKIYMKIKSKQSLVYSAFKSHDFLVKLYLFFCVPVNFRGQKIINAGTKILKLVMLPRNKYGFLPKQKNLNRVNCNGILFLTSD